MELPPTTTRTRRTTTTTTVPQQTRRTTTTAKTSAVHGPRQTRKPPPTTTSRTILPARAQHQSFQRQEPQHDLQPFGSTHKNDNHNRNNSGVVYRYAICNGLSNQFLHHVSHWARAHAEGYQHVEIPNAFVMHGAQDDSSTNVLPLLGVNAIPLTHVVDTRHLQDVLLRHYHLTSTLVPPSMSHNNDKDDECPFFAVPLSHASPTVVAHLLRDALRPSPDHVQPLLEALWQSLPSSSNGICVHHRTGSDWHRHCHSWSAIADGVYRRNCDLPNNDSSSSSSSSSSSLLSSLQSRVLFDQQRGGHSMRQAPQQPQDRTNTTTPHNASSALPWIYYCGDQPHLPVELVLASHEAHETAQKYGRSTTSHNQKPPLVQVVTSRPHILKQQQARQRQGVDDPNRTRGTFADLWERQRQFLIDQYGLTQLSAHKDTDWQSRYARDWGALLDFFTCRHLPQFVGNSVSTFSALQIALRQPEPPILPSTPSTASTATRRTDPLEQTLDPTGSIQQNPELSWPSSSWSVPSLPTAAYWYNSQSIPLSLMWNIYDIPLVYTFTEESMASGQYLLQASIASARHHMPPTTPIHVLYHGYNNTRFRHWLVHTARVILHQHENITWKTDLEEMRQHGDFTKSHLFLHAGNYFGTWQRIDVPLYVNTEYALLLDSDTILQQGFTLADLGLNLTTSIAMSSELEYPLATPANAGVLLMNLPYLRQTYDDFLHYILSHKETGGVFGGHPSPSDQGAYLTFYNDTVQYLDYTFNAKPYFRTTTTRANARWQEEEEQEKGQGSRGKRQRPRRRRRVHKNTHKKKHRSEPVHKIVHFHGPKPHHFLSYILFGQDCPEAFGHLCAMSWNEAPESLCHALAAFAQASFLSSAVVDDDETLAPSKNQTTNSTIHLEYCHASFAPHSLQVETCHRVMKALAAEAVPGDALELTNRRNICANAGEFTRFLIASMVQQNMTAWMTLPPPAQRQRGRLVSFDSMTHSNYYVSSSFSNGVLHQYSWIRPMVYLLLVVTLVGLWAAKRQSRQRRTTPRDSTEAVLSKSKRGRSHKKSSRHSSTRRSDSDDDEEATKQSSRSHRSKKRHKHSTHNPPREASQPWYRSLPRVHVLFLLLCAVVSLDQMLQSLLLSALSS